MNPLWTDRTIRGPAAEQLTPDQFCQLFGLTDEFYETAVEDGVIPAPVKLTAKKQFHPWEHAVYFSLWMRFSGVSVKRKL